MNGEAGLVSLSASQTTDTVFHAAAVEKPNDCKLWFVCFLRAGFSDSCATETR